MQPRQLGIFLLVITTFIWGTTFVLVKATVSIIPIDGFLFVRFALAFVILFVITLFKRDVLKYYLDIKSWMYGFILGSLLFSSFWFQTVGLSLTTPSKAAFITGLSVILVPILGIYPFKNKLSKIEIVTAIMALIGLALMTLNIKSLSSINKGDMLILFTAISLAYHILITPLASDINEYVLVTIQTLTIATEALIFAIYRQTLWIPGNEPLIVWITVFVTAILATAFAFVSQTFAQNNGVSPPVIAIIFSLEPVFALLIDIILKVYPSFQSFIGMIIILVSMIITSITISKQNNFNINKYD